MWIGEDLTWLSPISLKRSRLLVLGSMYIGTSNGQNFSTQQKSFRTSAHIFKGFHPPFNESGIFQVGDEIEWVWHVGMSFWTSLDYQCFQNIAHVGLLGLPSIFSSTFLCVFCNLTTLIFLCAGKEEQPKTKLFPAHFWIDLRIDFRSPFLGNLPPFPRKCAKIPANLREDEIYSHTEAAVDEGEHWTETTFIQKSKQHVVVDHLCSAQF